MNKFLLRFFTLLLITIISGIIYLNYFGLETNKFDNLIKSKVNGINQYVQLDFKGTKIHLNITKLNLFIKLKSPKILLKNNKVINLSKLDLFLSIKSFFSSDFLLEKAEISFEKNDIKDLTKISDIFLPKIINKQLNKVFTKGNIEGKIIVQFNKEGEIEKNYGFSGKILDATINLSKKFKIRDLTAEINYDRVINNNRITALINKGNLFELDLSNSTIYLNHDKNNAEIQTSLHTKGKILFPEIKKISTLIGLRVNSFKNIEAIGNLQTDINFNLDKKFKVNNLSLQTEGKVDFLKIQFEKNKRLKKYLTNYDSQIVFKKTNIKFIKSEFNQKTELDGLIKIGNKFDNFMLSGKYNYKKKKFNVIGDIDLTNSDIMISQLNYKKNDGKKASVNFDFNFILDKNYNINNLIFLSEQNRISCSNLKLNKKFEVDNFEKVKIKTFANKIKNNDFSINKLEKTIVSGRIFDAQNMLKSLYKESDKKIFSKNFNSEIKINFEKIFTGTGDNVYDFSMIGLINNGSYDKLNLKGNFSENEIIEMSIYKVAKDKKTVQIISDRARPFVQNYDFIKGFEGGKLRYDSVILKKKSSSNLIISDFKVSKVPVLAQLLTLASLQGIADTLTGEGIRFDVFEMQSNSTSGLLNIDEAVALGPAVSILLEGYVEKGKTVSLRGTLVPATKLNSIIASLPIIGDILVGKKTGEGVVGVSFKMKGAPKNIKTTVNPIKTLTPRFIVRAIEKMKKEKKNQTK